MNIATPSLQWPPNYTLRISARAKRISVVISQQKGLLVVIPKRKKPYLPSAIEAVLNEHRRWIEKHLGHWMQEQIQKQREPLFPNRFYFPAFSKEIIIEYQDNVVSPLRIKRSLHDPAMQNPQIFHGSASLMNPSFQELIQNSTNAILHEHIFVSGPLNAHAKIAARLKRILKAEAEHFLLPLLQALSQNFGFYYHQASLRSQSSLWGSCTASKKISLNSKLLFLPRSLIEYVLIHELCHTKELNHSKKFWSLLKRFDPHYLQHRKALRSAAQYLPQFLK